MGSLTTTDSTIFIFLMPVIYIIACIFLGVNGYQSKLLKIIVMIIGAGLLVLYYICMDYFSHTRDLTVFYTGTYGVFAYYCFMFWLSWR